MSNDSYRGPIKELAGECYDWGLTDAYTRVFNKLEAMRKSAFVRGDRVTSGYVYAIEQVAKLIDVAFDCGRADFDKARGRRMKNADVAIEQLIGKALKAGVLRRVS